VRCKIIVVDNECLQQVRNFKYLGCGIFYENGRDIQQELSKFEFYTTLLNQVWFRNFQQ